MDPVAARTGRKAVEVAQPIPVFVISLKRAAERRQSICEHLSSLGVQFEIFEAVDGSTLSDEEVEKLKAPGLKMNRGAVGCYLSHIRVYEQIVQRGYECGLILEDDTRLSKRAAAIIQTGLASRDFDYCFLHSAPENDRGHVYYDLESRRELGPGLFAYRLSDGPQTTSAYLLSQAGARRRLECAFPIRAAVDIYSTLPYRPDFWSFVGPTLAWFGEQSLTSHTSARTIEVASFSFPALRRFPWFARMRDTVMLRDFRKRMEVPRLQKLGRLPGEGRWRPLPEGRNVVLGT